MKKTTFILFAAIGIISFNSCKKDPLSCASADKTSALTDESITFTSCSENSERISWDFGDGNSEEGNSVTHSYSAAGTYLVKMTAYSKKDKEWDRTSVLVKITNPPVPAKRYLTKIILKSFLQLNGGNQWDNSFIDTSDPDVYLYFKTATGEFSRKTSYDTNTTQSDLPMTWNLAPDNYYLTNENWVIEIRDDDDLGGGNLYDTMNSWTFNPATSAASNGIISLTATSYSLDIYFEER